MINKNQLRQVWAKPEPKPYKSSSLAVWVTFSIFIVIIVRGC